MSKRYRIDLLLYLGMLMVWLFVCVGVEKCVVGVQSISIPFFMFGWMGITFWWFDKVPGDE